MRQLTTVAVMLAFSALRPAAAPFERNGAQLVRLSAAWPHGVILRLRLARTSFVSRAGEGGKRRYSAICESKTERPDAHFDDTLGQT